MTADPFITKIEGQNPDGYEANLAEGDTVTVQIKDPKARQSMTAPPVMTEATGFITDVDNVNGLYRITLSDGQILHMDTRIVDEYMEQRQIPEITAPQEMPALCP